MQNRRYRQVVLYLAWILWGPVFLAAAGAPQVQITQPALDATFDAGTYIEFNGEATDAEDGVLSGRSLEWSSNIDGVLGYSGQMFFMPSPGYHTIRLTATDSDANARTASTLINVRVTQSPASRKIRIDDTISDFLLDEKRGQIIVVNPDRNRVEFYDIETGGLGGVVLVGSEPMQADLTLDGDTLMVANYKSTYVSLVDLDTQSVVGTIPADDGLRPREILAMSDTLAMLFTAHEITGSPPRGGTFQIVDLIGRTANRVMDVAVTQHNWHAGPGPFFYTSADGYSPGGISMWEVTSTTISLSGTEYIAYGFPSGAHKLACNPQGTRIALGTELRARDFQLLGDLEISRDYFKCFDRTGRILFGVKSSAQKLAAIDTDNFIGFDSVNLPAGESLAGDLMLSADNRTLFAHTNAGISIVDLRGDVGPADLAVTDLSLAGSAIYFDRLLALRGSIINEGKTDIPCSFWVEFRCSPHPDMSDPIYYVCDSYVISPPLSPGESVNLATLNRTAYSATQIPPGDYYVQVLADAVGVIGEPDEVNNGPIIGPISFRQKTGASRWNGYR